MRKMRRIVLLPILICAVTTLRAAEKPWQKLSDPTVSEVAAKFKTPPSENSNSVLWGWVGPVNEETIVCDLDTLHARGFRIVTIEAGIGMAEPYLSEGWFKLVRFAAEQAKKRDMRVIIIDDGKYPSGFVNGKYTLERPELRMKALALAERVAAPAGETIERDLAPEIVSAIAIDAENRKTQTLDIRSRKIQFKAPADGKWEVVLAKWQFSTPDTRAVRTLDGSKTKENSMGDLIDPEASRLFIEWTHEQYKKHMGDLFGDPIVAFRGDEPEMTGVPWTPKIAEEFSKRKGYDVTAYMAAFVLPPAQMSDEQKRAKADYFDVWSELFATYFFDAQAEWCAANGIEATSHLNNDHLMPSLVRTTGDFYRAFRKYQIPGVDVIWSQVYPGKSADFVKYPSSASHLFGRPRALSESYAAYYENEPATYDVARFGVNYQVVRGINLFEFMSFPSSARGAARGPATAPSRGAGGNATVPAGGGARGYMNDPKVAQLIEYANRLTYVMAQGKPTAPIAILMPTMSMWLGTQQENTAANNATLKIAGQLLANQRDFDFIDDISVASGMKLNGGEFINASNQAYRAVLIPASSVLSKGALDRLQIFAKAGGKVVFFGQAPKLMVETTFLRAAPAGDLSWAASEASGEITPALLASLPKPDVSFAATCEPVKVMHRKWKDADVFFAFNEIDQPQSVDATLVGSGQVQQWDAQDATIKNVASASSQNGQVKLKLELGPHEAKLIVIGAPGVALAQ